MAYCDTPGQSAIADFFCGTTVQAAETWRGLFGSAAETSQTAIQATAETAQAVSSDASDTVQTVAPYSAAGAAVIGLGAIGLPLLLAGGVVGVAVVDQVAFQGAGRRALIKAF